MKNGKTHKKVKKLLVIAFVPKGCIYLITNLTNGKRYVGQYKDVLTVERRWYRHIYAAFNTSDPRPLYCAIRKAYRESKGKTLGFSAEVIWSGAADVEKLDAKEIYYIKKLHSFNLDPKGDQSYNLTKGGLSGILGFKFSEESKKQLSVIHLQRFAEDPSACEKLSIAQLLSYKENPARRKQQSDGRRRWLEENPTAHEQLSAVQLRRYEDQAARDKTGTAATIAWAKPGARDRQSAAQLRRYADPAEHEKQSAGSRRRYEDPIEREKQRVAQNKRFESQAERDKNGVATKANWAKRTPEERSAIGFKARDTRRANKAAKVKVAKKK